MAQRKKKAQTKKKGGRKAAKKQAPRRHAQREQQPAYSAEQRASFSRPAENYDEVATDALEAWKRNSRYVKLPNLTAGRFARTIREAVKAWDKEKAVRAALDAKLRPLIDRRMAAEDAAADALGDLYAQVKASARQRPELEEAFASLYQYMSRPASSRRRPDPTSGNGGLHDDPSG